MGIYVSNSGIYNYKQRCHFLTAEYITVLILVNTEYKPFNVTHYVCVSSKQAQVVKHLTYFSEATSQNLSQNHPEVFNGFSSWQHQDSISTSFLPHCFQFIVQ
jgi:hypothetical protein